MRSRKLQALDFIKGYFAQWGASPSLSEIGAALGISRQRASKLVGQLSREAQIRKAAGKGRGITLPDDAGGAIGEASLLVRLAALGWRIDPGALTERRLSGLPVLDHPRADEVGVGNHDGDETG
jgi:SOS-response transcriptional repressor LexA